MVRGGRPNREAKRARVFAITKGFRGRAKNCYSIAVRAAHRALQHAYRGRKLKKRDMRKLWIQRINFASREHAIGYGQFIHNLIRCNIQLNRKVLSELAIHEPRTFQALAEIAKRRNRDGLTSVLDEVPRCQPSTAEALHEPQATPTHGTWATPTGSMDISQPELYHSREVVMETGRRVLETPV